MKAQAAEIAARKFAARAGESTAQAKATADKLEKTNKSNSNKR